MNTSDARPFQLLYVSHLTPGEDPGVMEAIAAVSRTRNLNDAISSALLFDGRRFCQLLEGPEFKVRSLMRRIEFDPRRSGVSVLVKGHFGDPRMMTRWRSGRCSESVLDPLSSIPQARNADAIAWFMSALASSYVA